ncbi:MAG: YggS family pyridoxal phosphate-dependent enzyme [Burkholderiales bacterium]|nr:YggS family pyridoxal phosphate-dependent enzyme [Burkholderiales bacterium]
MTASSEASQATSRLLAVRQRIAAACRASRRAESSVTLLAVSKLQPTQKIRELHAAGHRAFGENYVQEALAKHAELSGDVHCHDIEWHLIGPLQSNKTRAVAETLHWVHSVDRLKIAERLSAQRPPSLPPLNVCIQVNISDEASKSGCAPLEAVPLAVAVSKLPNLRLRGLMGMPAPGLAPEATRAQFALLAALYAEASTMVPGMDTLSMGMSDDLELAIACGSTMVRVGTALFGLRPAVA